ncbi:MAG: hypothetical protein ABII09_12695 [Planctomycetota bacterium]
MTRKIIAGVAGCVLLAAIALFAAEKAQKKQPPEKPKQQAKAVDEQQKGLLDQLIVAYKADDREKMGEIIKKMETRRDKMQKLAKLNKWHQGVHRRWALAGVGGGRGRQMAGPCRGPGWQQMPRGAQSCQRPCCWQGAAASAGWGPQPGMQRPMHRGGQQPGGFGWQDGMAGRGAMAGRPGQMRGWGQQPGQFVPMWQWRQGPGANMPQNWNMPAGGKRQENIPPADWGW